MKIYDFNYIPVNGDKVDATIERVLHNNTELPLTQRDRQFLSQGCVQIYKQTDTDHVTNKRQFICDVRKGLGTCHGQCFSSDRECRVCAAFIAEQEMYRFLKGKEAAKKHKFFSLQRLLNNATVVKREKDI